MLLNDRFDVQNASTGTLLTCLLLIFHRQMSPAFQRKTTLELEVELLRAHYSGLLPVVQIQCLVKVFTRGGKNN